MADPLVLTNRLNRGTLQQFLNDLRDIKAFEALSADVSGTLPETLNAQLVMIEKLGDEVASLFAAAASARAAADRALAAARQVEDLLQVRRSDRATIQALQRRIDDLETILLNRRR